MATCVLVYGVLVYYAKATRDMYTCDMATIADRGILATLHSCALRCLLVADVLDCAGYLRLSRYLRLSLHRVPSH